MMTFEHFWGHDAAFSTLTRATVPPVKVGTSLQNAGGAIGLRLLNDPSGKLYDPAAVPFGLHPKTAIRFAELYEKPVPAVRLQTARLWIEKHISYHLAQEEAEIQRKKAREQRTNSGPSSSPLRRFQHDI
jgi:hypothetical protein